MSSARVESNCAIAAVISFGCVSHNRVDPSTSANSNVTVPVGSSLTASSLHSVALMLASMRPARTPKHQRMRVYLRPPAADIRPSTDLVRAQTPDSRHHDHHHRDRTPDHRVRARPELTTGTRADPPSPTARTHRHGPAWSRG